MMEVVDDLVYLDGPGCGVEDDDEECLCDVKNSDRHPLVVVLSPSAEGLYPHEAPEIDFLTALLRKRRFPFEVASLFTGPYQADRSDEWSDRFAAVALENAYHGRRLILVGHRVARAFAVSGPQLRWFGTEKSWVVMPDHPFWETAAAKEAPAWLRRALARKYD